MCSFSGRQGPLAKRNMLDRLLVLLRIKDGVLSMDGVGDAMIGAKGTRVGPQIACKQHVLPWEVWPFFAFPVFGRAWGARDVRPICRSRWSSTPARVGAQAVVAAKPAARRAHEALRLSDENPGRIGRRQDFRPDRR